VQDAEINSCATHNIVFLLQSRMRPREMLDLLFLCDKLYRSKRFSGDAQLNLFQPAAFVAASITQGTKR